MKIAHLLITRFNLQFDKENTLSVQSEWLEARMRLFETYCMPSVAGQTCKDFTWLLLCAINTPEQYKQRISAYAAHLPQLSVQWVPFMEDYQPLLSRLGASYAKGNDVLVTSRLDNDDALGSDYIERVQEIVREGTEGFISFPLGKQTFAKENKSYIVRYVRNHFTSRIEKEGFDTVMAFNHAILPIESIRTIETPAPMWEEIVHGGNMLNDYMPSYNYQIRTMAEGVDLCRRWFHFQRLRLNRWVKSFFRKS